MTRCAKRFFFSMRSCKNLLAFAGLLCLIAFGLALPSPALAQFDFADALVVKIRTYPIKMTNGKPVPGPDGMPQPESLRGGKPAGLEELPAIPIDVNFPGGSILDALAHYQKRDPIAVMGPVLAVFNNGYMEMDIVKPCIVDAVKIKFDHHPTEQVPSFKENGLAALMRIVHDGALASELRRERDRLVDRYNAGATTTPDADQNRINALSIARLMIARTYNPKVVRVAWKDLPPFEAKQRFKAEVVKGQPMETDLVMGPLKISMLAKVNRRKISPAPEGCPGARPAMRTPGTLDGNRATRASFSGDGPPAYLASLKPSLAPNGRSNNGHAPTWDGRPTTGKHVNASPSPRVLLAQDLAVGGYVSFRASIKPETWNPNGDVVAQSTYNVFSNISVSDSGQIADRWKKDKDNGLEFNYGEHEQYYGLTHNVGQDDETMERAQPRGLIDWRLQGADQGIKGMIDHLIQIYKDRNKYNLTADQAKGIAETIYSLVNLRYAWGTMTADDVWIWRRVWRQGMEPDAAREALERLKGMGMKAEDLLAQGTEKQENNYVTNFLNQREVPQQQQGQYVSYLAAAQPVSLSPGPVNMTFLAAFPTLGILIESIRFISFMKELNDVYLDLEEGKICIFCALEDTTSLMDDYGYRLRNGVFVSYGRYWGVNDFLRATDYTPNRLYGTVTQGGYSWERSYPVLEGQNVIAMPVWSYMQYVASGPCIKGAAAVPENGGGEEDEWELKASVRLSFSPKTIGINTYKYFYGTSGGSGLASLLPCSGVVVEQDPLLDLDATPNDPLFSAKGDWGQKYEAQWALQRIGFKALEDKTSAWHITSGTERPVVVAVIDSGIDLTHPDLNINNIWYNEKEVPGNGIDDDKNGFIDDLVGWDFVHNHNNPYDITGHGTHVAGIIAARWNNGRGIAGINRGARIMVLKAFNEVGKGWGSNVAQAVVYAVNNGAKIINISASHEGHTKFLEHVFDWARTKGALVIVSAGNKGIDTKNVEAANQPGTLTVGATLPDDKRAPFSNWGQEVDVAAPGVDVVSLRAKGTDLIRFIAEDPKKFKPEEAVVGSDRAYYRAGGTSFSTPLVTGLASLIWAKNPKLKAEQVSRMIVQSARDIEIPGWDQFTGYGLVDARAALTADPNWYLVAKVHALEGAMENGKPVIKVLGTVDGNDLDGYEVDIAKGKDEPKEWRTVARKSAKKVIGGVAAKLTPEDFGEPGTWTVRIVARDKSGRNREARGVITLQ